MFDRLKYFGLAGFAALSSRILIIAAGTVTSLVLPLALQASDVGTFFLIQTWIAGFAVLSQFGLTMSVPAIVTAAVAVGHFGRARRAISITLVICAVIGIATGVAVWMGLQLLAHAAPRGTVAVFAELAPQIAVTIPLVALVAVLAEELRALQAVVAASLLGIGTTAFTAVYVIVAYTRRDTLTLTWILNAGIVGAVASALCGGLLLYLSVRRWAATPDITVPEVTVPDIAVPGIALNVPSLVGHALPNFVTTLTLFVVSQADIWMLGAFGTPTELAHYGLAIRLASLLLIPLAVVNAVITPTIVELWTQRKTAQLQTLLRLTATLQAAAAVGLYLCFVLFGRIAIGAVWGRVYDPVYFLLLVVGAGQVIHAIAGSSGVLLVLLGQQMTAMRLTIAFGICTIAIALMIVHSWMAIGIAAVFAAGNILQTMSFARAVRRHFDLAPYASPASLREFVR